ncbi:anti-sigma-factor antagonist [Magnetococcus marinus MC-1]|uniref:Anti-sigma-factor antagonist n=1 Tax=Magnetococcus marinus (strain ATCC BAA-1437 / JCM 17883 / MC-1) TaxID=156889 RepID=A0L430_MAGMM|nr:STAS domain-containing protein [Magnetococcus marinus]ABK42723.1 anti-sigma-factor antagonist [Magnetococcus marinus MC-1]
MLTLHKEVQEGVVILILEGRFDVSSIETFQEAYADQPPGTIFKIHLDKVTYIDSAAFGLFHALKQHLGNLGRVMLYNPSDEVTHAIQVLGAHRSFEIMRFTTHKPLMHHGDDDGF